MFRRPFWAYDGRASSSLSPRERAGGEGLCSLAHPSEALTLTLSQRERGDECMAKRVSCFCTRYCLRARTCCLQGYAPAAHNPCSYPSRSMWYWCLGVSRKISFWRRLIIKSKWLSTSRPRTLRSVAVGSIKPANSPCTRAGPPSSRTNSTTVVTHTKALVPPIPLRVKFG